MGRKQMARTPRGYLRHWFRSCLQRLSVFPVDLDLFCCNQPAKMLKGTIIGPFSIRGKTATRKLPALQVVLDALAARTPPGAFAIAAGAFFDGLFLPAFHQCAA
jgi:hypothetical protein